RDTIEEQRKGGEFGQALISAGDKIFLKLSYDQSIARRKFAVIQEVMKIQNDTYYFGEVPVVMRADIRHEDIPLPNGGKWPEDRYVPVPTQTSEWVWGVELSAKQFDELTSFSKSYPHIFAELQLSAFSATAQVAR